MNTPRSLVPVFLVAMLFPLVAPAQVSLRPASIPAEHPPRVHALVGATVIPEPGVRWERAVVVIRDGRVVAAGPDVPVPPAARAWDLAGHVVHAGYVDAHAPLGGSPKGPDVAGPRPENERIRAAVSVAATLEPLPEAFVEARRKLGFTAAMVVPARGLWRGTGALVALKPGRPDQVVLGEGPQVVALEYGSGTGSTYPTSLMGAVALLRQSAHDAAWLAAATRAWETAPSATRPERPAPDLQLEALARHLPGVAGDAALPVAFTLRDELDVDIAARLVAEFGFRGHLVGSGHEYRRVAAYRELGLPVVLPLAFPKAPAVGTPSQALAVSLDVLQHWHRAPANARDLAAAGVTVALSPHAGTGSFWEHLRRAVEVGLPRDVALAALTTVPARLVGAGDTLGRIAPGAFAHLAVWDGDPFSDAKAEVVMTWVDGEPQRVESTPEPDPTGRWAIAWSGGAPEGVPGEFVVRAKGRSGFTFAWGEDVTGDLKWGAGRWTTSLRAKDAAKDQPATLVEVLPASADRRRATSLVGSARLPDGTWRAWSASRTGDAPEAGAVAAEASREAAPAEIPVEPLPWPAGAHGRRGDPARPAVVLLRGATVWTQAEAGVVEGGDVLVRDGRIAAVGRGLEAPEGAVVVDVSGRHVTPGLIDAHSHVAIRGGVNEFGSSISAECRLVDVLDPTDIDLVRQLAFGVTTAHLLHGSANPIGGQNAFIKLRWGRDAAGLLLEGAPPGVKFALGENPKRSNYLLGTNRYPQTRLGVEQVYVDAFSQARVEDAVPGLPPRRDLRAEAVREIALGERQIHVHAYRADEILMFVRLAQRFGLRVATFQHVLEGYKVAPEIAALGAGASTFADIWNYKVELRDAIPWNSALLHRAGVVTSVNSDNAELARRLHLEAAKAVRFGGLSEEEALALVTSNPARQLGLADRIGSLRPGLDADLVVWSGHPLSTASRVEQTWIDGARWHDAAEAAEQARADAAEHARLVALAQRGASRPGRDEPAGKESGPGEAAAAPPSTWFAAEGAGTRSSPWDRGLYHDGGTPATHL